MLIGGPYSILSAKRLLVSMSPSCEGMTFSGDGILNYAHELMSLGIFYLYYIQGCHKRRGWAKACALSQISSAAVLCD